MPESVKSDVRRYLLGVVLHACYGCVLGSAYFCAGETHHYQVPCITPAAPEIDFFASDSDGAGSSRLTHYNEIKSLHEVKTIGGEERLRVTVRGRDGWIRTRDIDQTGYNPFCEFRQAMKTLENGDSSAAVQRLAHLRDFVDRSEIGYTTVGGAPLEHQVYEGYVQARCSERDVNPRYFTSEAMAASEFSRLMEANETEQLAAYASCPFVYKACEGDHTTLTPEEALPYARQTYLAWQAAGPEAEVSVADSTISLTSERTERVFMRIYLASSSTGVTITGICD